jgi:SAM-dependent methyltransferase
MLGSRDGLMVAGNSRFPGRRCAMAGSVETFQVSVEAAEVYESKFVPAIFGEWAPHLVDAAGVAPGQAVLDVGCGTGVVAREAADRMGGQGSVVGLDLNEGMLAVARRLRPDIEWRQGDAAEVP